MENQKKAKKITKHKLIVFVCIFFAIGSFFFFAFKDSRTNKSTSELSSRSKEFIKANIDNQTNVFRSVELGKSRNTTINKKFTIGNCFSIKIPFLITNVKHTKECSDWFFTDSPKGNITAYANSFNGLSIDEDSGVQLRRMKKEEYAEEVYKAKDKEFLMFTKNSDQFEFSAFYLQNKTMYVINFFSNTNGDFSRQFKEMLNSFEVMNTNDGTTQNQ